MRVALIGACLMCAACGDISKAALPFTAPGGTGNLCGAVDKDSVYRIADEEEGEKMATTYIAAPRDAQDTAPTTGTAGGTVTGSDTSRATPSTTSPGTSPGTSPSRREDLLILDCTVNAKNDLTLKVRVEFLDDKEVKNVVDGATCDDAVNRARDLRNRIDTDAATVGCVDRQGKKEMYAVTGSYLVDVSLEGARRGRNAFADIAAFILQTIDSLKIPKDRLAPKVPMPTAT
jgi:hypothetical protein